MIPHILLNVKRKVSQTEQKVLDNNLIATYNCRIRNKKTMIQRGGEAVKKRPEIIIGKKILMSEPVSEKQAILSASLVICITIPFLMYSAPPEKPVRRLYHK